MDFTRLCNETRVELFRRGWLDGVGLHTADAYAVFRIGLVGGL